jgi:GntR family transcriptional regulator
VEENEVNLQIDFRSGTPIYLQVVEQIKQMLLQGKLHPEDHLPTVRQLAAELRVNFNTIARAYRILDEAGLISTQQGRGTFILAEPDEKAVQFIRTQSLEDLTRKYLADALGVGATEQEIRIVLEQEFHRNQEIRKEGLR